MTDASIDDLHSLVALAAGSSGVHTSTFEALASDLCDASRHLVVARVDNRLVGYGRVRYHARSDSLPVDSAPRGWYLIGLVVADACRRHGVGSALTRARMEWRRERTGEVWYFANARNPVSIVLHARFGFVEVTRQFSFPGVSFSGGAGVLFRARWAHGAMMSR